jgi:hypothetical protein
MPFDVHTDEDLGRIKEEARRRANANGSEHTGTVKVLTVENVMQAKTHKPEMLVETVVPVPGVVLVVAPHKTGKTLFALQLSMSIAAGVSVCDFYRVLKSGPVLFIEKDDPGGLASVQDILRRTRIPVSESPFYTVTDIDMTLAAEFILWLEAEIVARNLRLVVIDSYTAIRAAHTSGGDLVKREADDLGLLDQLAKKYNLTILLIHHYSKGSVNHDWSERAAGTFAMGAMSEAQIVLTRYPDLASNAPERLVRVRGRHLAGTDMVLRLDPETLAFEHVLEGGAASFYPEIQQLRTEFGVDAFSPKTVSHELGMARATAHRLIGRLLATGAVRKSGYGEYVLVAL